MLIKQPFQNHYAKGKIYFFTRERKLESFTLFSKYFLYALYAQGVEMEILGQIIKNIIHPIDEEGVLVGHRFPQNTVIHH